MNTSFKILSNILIVIVMIVVWPCRMSAGHPTIDYMAVSVFAGDDQIICSSETLDILSLEAEISGMATNGYWFTDGDGQFEPCNENNCRFTEATIYVPGTLDILNGGFNLILVSDDPDGIGPMPQVVDEVYITLMNNIPIVCNSFLNVSLNNNCEQLITPNMLVTNLQQPADFYTLELRDNTNKIIANNTVTATEINENVTFIVGHRCGPNTCWGSLYVQDKLPPPLQCKNKTIDCGTPTQADSLGLPVSGNAIITKINPYTYTVLDFDACGSSTLTFADSYTEYQCDSVFQSQLKRTWSATDGSGNKSSCSQYIKIKNKTFAQVVFPPNFDGITKNHLECGGTWPVDVVGNPSPDTTGMPNVTGCTNMGAFYTDTRFELCGDGYKLLRVWEVINWCNTESFTQNQLIEIKDSKAPTFACPGDITINTAPYECATGLFTLPLPTQIADCSDVHSTVEIKDVLTQQDYTTYVINNSNNTHSVNRLPLGKYLVYYIVLDECSNRDTCQYLIDVVDKIAPIPICDQFTKVVLGSNGVGRMLAATLDDGSHDNCSPVVFKVSKNTGVPVFGDYIDYTCDDLLISQMAILRITDAAGNSNTCMVVVDLQDKLPPVIHCPSNLTIACSTPIDFSDLTNFGKVVVLPNPTDEIIINDHFNNGFAGYDGYAQDNCIPFITDTFTENLNCHQGSISRTFTATDQDGNSSSCIQIIEVLNPDHFDASDIIFPSNIEIDGCDTANAITSITGIPKYTSTTCANVGATYEDVPFYFTDNACIKIIRTWTVIDWCQFDPITGEGKWQALQIIKLNNAVKPVIESMCKDTTVCLFTEDCSNQSYAYNILASDDCALPTNLNYNWTLDLNGNGTNDKSGSIATIQEPLTIGSHVVKIQVSDNCGNEATCNYTVMVKDCKKPTPYCITSISTVLMPSSGNLNITAKSFDLNSFDNCTPNDSLIFSFSANVLDKVKTITCEDIQNGISQWLPLQIWVTDKSGNQEYCSTEITINDNDNVCPDDVQFGEVSGSISTYDNTKNIKGVSVHLSNQQHAVHQTKLTDNLGYFAIGGVPLQGISMLKPKLSFTIVDGISTLDIIKIQRHILGSEKFNNPYQIIASDVDGNNKVTVSDLVVLRKLVLNLTDKLPNNKPCWSFIDREYEFLNNNLPFNFPDSMVIKPFIGNQSSYNDFYAIKIGDVNNSFVQLKDENESENRSRDKVTIHAEGNDDKTTFILEDDIQFSGYEFVMNVGNVDPESIQIESDHDENLFYHYEDGSIKIIFYPTNSISLKKGDVLFHLNIREEDVSGFDGTVFDDQLQELSVEFGTKSSDEPKMIVKFNHKLIIVETNESTMTAATIMVFDIMGRVVYPSQNIQISSYQPYELQVGQSMSPGAYFIQIRHQNKIFTKKIIL